MHSIFANPKIVQEILVRSQNNFALSQVNKQFYSVANHVETKAKWIEYRKKELKLWIKTFHLVIKEERVFESFSEWLAYQVYPVYQDNTTFGNLLSNDLVILQLLKNALDADKESLVEMYWDVLASRGSLEGLAFALKNPKMHGYFETNITMPTNAIYVSLLPSKPIDDTQSLDLLKFFSTFGPRETALEEAFEYGCVTHKLPIVKHAMSHSRFPTILGGLIQSKSAEWKDLETQIYTFLKIEQKQDWDQLKALLELVQKDKCYLFKTDFIKVYETQKTDHVFLEYWTSCVATAISSRALNTLEFLLNIEQFPKADLYVPLSLFCRALDLGDDEVCEMVVQHLDCSDSKMELGKKLQIILEEYCAMSKRQLLSRLYPLTCLVEPKPDVIKYIQDHQTKIVTFLIKALRKRNSNFVIPSVCLWKSYQVGNDEITFTLQDLGGVATWLDTDRPGATKMKMELSTGQQYVDDVRTGLFQAFGGHGMPLMEIENSIIEEMGEEDDELLQDTDFSKTVRASVEMLAMERNAGQRRSANTIGWTDYRLSRRKSAMHGSAILGSKRVVLRSQETSRLFVPRKSSFANVESDRIWNNYFSAKKNEIEKIFAQSERIEWMEPDSVEPQLNQGYNASQEAPMVNEIAKLY